MVPTQRGRRAHGASGVSPAARPSSLSASLTRCNATRSFGQNDHSAEPRRHSTAAVRVSSKQTPAEVACVRAGRRGKAPRAGRRQDSGQRALARPAQPARAAQPSAGTALRTHAAADAAAAARNAEPRGAGIATVAAFGAVAREPRRTRAVSGRFVPWRGSIAMRGVRESVRRRGTACGSFAGRE
jgi:hypothetical protein